VPLLHHDITAIYIIEMTQIEHDRNFYPSKQQLFHCSYLQTKTNYYTTQTLLIPSCLATETDPQTTAPSRPARMPFTVPLET
jgi:hypothetical protein